MLIYLAVVGVVSAVVTGVAISAGTPQSLRSQQAFAQHLQQLGLDRFMTAPAQSAVAMAASGNRQLGPKGQLGQGSPVQLGDTVKLASRQSTNVLASGLTNVRVNNPSEDSHFMDQTTQSETTIGVHGSNVVVGFNDSQQTLLALTAASNLTAYGYSTNGGSTFTDGGSIPNAPAFNNFGDPWLGSDRSGNFYYSTLMLDGTTGNLDIGVAKSTDGGKTFSAPTVVSPSNDLFYFGDKDALAVGRDPTTLTRDDIYVAWDDEFADQNFNFFTGLPVARSTDGGKTWHVTYADKVPDDTTGCSFTQYIGATPAVAPSGTLYVAAEKISVDDPGCIGVAPTFSEWIFKSTNGGRTLQRRQADRDCHRDRRSQPRPGHGDAEPRVPVDRGRDERHRLRRLERQLIRPQQHPSRNLNQRRRQLDSLLGHPGNPGQCAACPQRRQQRPPPPLLPAQPKQHARRAGKQLNERRHFVHHHPCHLSLVPRRVHRSAVRPHHRVRLHGGLHRQRHQRDNPLLRLGRQPRHNQELPLAAGSPRPQRLLRTPTLELQGRGGHRPPLTAAVGHSGTLAQPRSSPLFVSADD